MFNEQEMKFLRLALDPGAHEGEIDNAMAKLIQSLRVRLAKPEDFESAKFTPGKETPRQEQAKQTSGVDWGSTTFNFGKMKGKPIRDADPGYLMWCRDWIRSGDEDLETRYGNIAKAIDKFLGE